MDETPGTEKLWSYSQAKCMQAICAFWKNTGDFPAERNRSPARAYPHNRIHNRL